MSRNLFVGGAEQEQSNTSDDERTSIGYATQPEEQFRVPTGVSRRHSKQNVSRPERPMEAARTTELEERTRVLEMVMGKILSRLIPDDPLIPLLNRGEPPVTAVTTCHSPTLSNVVIPTKPRGSGRLNTEPSSSKHSDELMKKNVELEKQLKDLQRSVDELKCPRRWCLKLPKHSVTSYPQLAMLFSNKFASQREIKRTATELMQVHQREGESLRDYMQRFNKATLDIDNFSDTICLSAPLHGLKPGKEPDIVMPYAYPFVATVHIGNHNVNKVFIDKGTEPRFRMASVSFLVVKMEAAYNAIIGRATLCELKVVISQPHLYMKFPTPQGIWVLKGNQKMARACYQDTFKKVEPAAMPKTPLVTRPNQPGLQAMSISDIDYRLENVEQKAELVKPVEIVALDSDNLEKMVKIGTKLTEKERIELLQFLKANQDVFAWTIDEMPRIPAEFVVHKLIPGYVMPKKGIEVNSDKVVAVQQMEPPKTVKEVQRLTGRLVALHSFIARSAEKCLPFFKALREPNSFQWTSECQ
ncbi:hypothetical protein SLEP1_g18739 [Rubroshorea leprosula]|uniref:Retrotransposon gag domain-containing protein n=1 Tax=Rubroshorea leprosula TaxID=152421 RepID=A0AAV5IYJ4_9ROSI|nr:hypothetical protein SLEP1_g18739 [Rubroshorea leprosula]